MRKGGGGISFNEFDTEKWKLVVDVNLCGFFNTSKAEGTYNEETMSDNDEDNLFVVDIEGVFAFVYKT